MDRLLHLFLLFFLRSMSTMDRLPLLLLLFLLLLLLLRSMSTMDREDCFGDVVITEVLGDT
jgi:hypothetical protein